MGRYQNFTPPTLGSELSTAEIVLLEELTALANSSAGQFIRKESGSLVNATLAETITLANLSDVTISSVAQGDLIYYNGSGWVNLSVGSSGQVLTISGGLPAWGGSGTVTSVSVVTANGVSGSVATATTTPAITLTLGSITPSAIQISGLTASEIVGTDASKNLVSLAVATYPSLTELTYVKGVSSAIQTQLAAKAGTALSNLASVAINTTLVSDTDNTDALGTSAIAWSDLFLGSGAVITFNSAPSTADVTITHSADTLTFAGGTIILGTATATGGLTGDVTGNVSGTAATVTGAAQAAITSLGTLTTLTVDDITINGNTISSAGASTLAITPTAGQAITFDGTVTLDAGVVAGMTSLTMSGNLVMQANSITMTGSLAATGARVTKGWFTDVESTNMYTVGGTSLSSTFAGIAQTMYIGTTAHALNRASAAEGLAGITSLTPGADFTLSQNSVNVLTSENTGAIVNTLYLKAGNVGIGTTAPGVPLHLFSSSAQAMMKIQDDRGAVSGTPGLDLIKSRSGGAALDNDIAGIIYFSFLNDNATPARKQAATITGTVTDASDTTEDGILTFSTMKAGTLTEQVRIDNQGNVGIGTTGPAAKLEVSDSAASMGVRIASTDANGRPFINFRRNTTTDIGTIQAGLTDAFGVNGDNIFIENPVAGGKIILRDSTGNGLVQSAGNVGIGVTSPTAVLHLKAGTATASTAPFKFTSGVVNTTPEAGAFEWDGTDLWISV